MKKVGIYIHIPFCKQKCKYCDFVSFQCMDDKMEEYFNCLTQEIIDKADELNIKIDESNSDNNLENNSKKCIEIDTIYIGGGTPSIVSEKVLYDANLPLVSEILVVSPNTTLLLVPLKDTLP